jgi:hypothetical protein
MNQPSFATDWRSSSAVATRKKQKAEAEKAPRRSTTLIGTAKLNGIDPESYLRKVLSRISISSRSFLWNFPAAPLKP